MSRTSPQPTRRLGTLDRLAQYVLVPRLAAVGLTWVVAMGQSRIPVSLTVALVLLLGVNYLALRHWVYVSDTLRIAAKPMYLALDIALGLAVLAVVGAGTPLVLYLAGSALLAGLTHRARFATAAAVAVTLGYLGLVAVRAGRTPAAHDVHSLVTLPAMILGAAAGAVAVRIQTVRAERSRVKVAQLQEQAAVREERLRLSRDLHDTLTKSLHGIWLLSRTLDGALERDDLPAARRSAAVIGSAAQQLTGQAREVILDLREAPRATFASALRDAVRQTVAGHPLQADVDVAPGVDEACWSEQVNRELIAVAAEAVHNTVKHARAGQVRVEAALDGGRLRLAVHDDGIGPGNAAHAGRPGAPGHFGVQGMRERVGRLGGVLDISGQVGQGTTVLLSVPLRSAAGTTPAPDTTGLGAGHGVGVSHVG